jgi:hypothetical protein
VRMYRGTTSTVELERSLSACTAYAGYDGNLQFQVSGHQTTFISTVFVGMMGFVCSL